MSQAATGDGFQARTAALTTRSAELRARPVAASFGSGFPNHGRSRLRNVVPQIANLVGFSKHVPKPAETLWRDGAAGPIPLGRPSRRPAVKP